MPFISYSNCAVLCFYLLHVFRLLFFRNIPLISHSACALLCFQRLHVFGLFCFSEKRLYISFSIFVVLCILRIHLVLFCIHIHLVLFCVHFIFNLCCFVYIFTLCCFVYISYSSCVVLWFPEGDSKHVANTPLGVYTRLWCNELW